jgi:hypothetical protein
MNELRACLETWDGAAPSSETWMAALRQASDEARRHVEQAEQVAAALRKGRLESQREAARRRPLLELGRFLVCMVDSAGNLNERGDDDETICEHSHIEQVKGKIISGKGIGRDVIARFLAGISAMTKSATTESGGVTATLPAPLLHAKSAVTHVSDPG